MQESDVQHSVAGKVRDLQPIRRVVERRPWWVNIGSQSEIASTVVVVDLNSGVDTGNHNVQMSIPIHICDIKRTHLRLIAASGRSAGCADHRRLSKGSIAIAS